MNTHTNILLASMVGLETAHCFSAFNPSVFTIRHFVDSTTARDVREGEILGVLYSLALGLVVSLIIRSWWPMVFAIGTDVFMVAVYEHALRTSS